MFAPLQWLGAVLLLLTRRTGSVLALDNGLAQVPPMGWNSWNTFHCNVDEDLLVAMADTIKDLGLDQLGYQYVNIDDCWMAPHRNHQGQLFGDPKRFASGMKWMGDYLHQQNLKFGIYSSAGWRTCARFPASLGHEAVDAQTFADWGVDYLKYDNCFNLRKPGIHRYAAMRNALNATGRPILYSLCQWGTEESWQWASTFGNTWRTTGDIEPDWNSIVGCFWQSQQHAEQSRSGAWLDPDMLEVGHDDASLTLAENRAHFALWVLAKAPLLLGNDLRSMSPEIHAIVSNRHLIAIHQNPAFPQATCYVGCDRQAGVSWCPPTVEGEHIIDEMDVLNPNKECTHNLTTRSAWGHTDYSIFATKRVPGGGSSSREPIVVALIVNWHDTEPLAAHALNAVQVLGVSPYPNERVMIRELYSNQLVTVPPAHDNNSFDFEALQKVPVPAVAPHDVLVYSFTVVEASTPNGVNYTALPAAA